MLQVTELYIYPIKSLSGIKLSSAEVTDRGLKYDRRWMLVDANNRFVSQREFPNLALLKTSISSEFLTVTNLENNTCVKIPLESEIKPILCVTIWDDTCFAQLVDDDINAWFTNVLGLSIRLVYMPDESHRFIDERFAINSEITSFADAYPFLLIGQSSLDDLNARLNLPLLINRFRPNIVFKGAEPYFEDVMDNFAINQINFKGVKLCARCNVITINQEDASTSKEPTKTLAGYRAKNNKLYLGQNLIHSGTGIISVGDELTLLTIHTDERFIIPQK